MASIASIAVSNGGSSTTSSSSTSFSSTTASASTATRASSSSSLGTSFFNVLGVACDEPLLVSNRSSPAEFDESVAVDATDSLGLLPTLPGLRGFRVLTTTTTSPFKDDSSASLFSVVGLGASRPLGLAWNLQDRSVSSAGSTIPPSTTFPILVSENSLRKRIGLKKNKCCGLCCFGKQTYVVPEFEFSIVY